MITITAEQIERVNLILSGVPGGIEKALSSTIRRANNTVRSETLKGITTVYAITRQNVRAETTIKVRTQSSDGGIVGTVLFAGHKIIPFLQQIRALRRDAPQSFRTICTVQTIMSSSASVADRCLPFIVSSHSATSSGCVTDSRRCL